MKIETKDTSKTILVIVLGLSLLSWWLGKPVIAQIGAIIGVASLMFGIVAKWIEIIWFKIATILGWINSRIILSLLFFVFLFPLALLSRLTNKNPLMLKKENTESYYTERNYEYQKHDLEKMW